MSVEELKETVMDIAVSLSGNGDDKVRCHDVIDEIISRRVLSKTS